MPATLRRSIRQLISPLDEVALVYAALGRISPDMVMVDVGAHHGTALARFAESGGQVIAFEPDADNLQVLATRYGSLPNLRIDARAVGDENASDVPFYTSPTSTGISGLSVFEQHHRQAGTVETITLGAFFVESPTVRIDFLKIDTEGFDLHVLRGLPWDRVTPRFVVCEFEDRKTLPLGYDYHTMATFLQARGYSIMVSEWYPITRYGAAHRWRRFGVYPAPLVSANGWGNLVACVHQSDFARLLSRASRASRIMRATSLLRAPQAAAH